MSHPFLKGIVNPVAPMKRPATKKVQVYEAVISGLKKQKQSNTPSWKSFLEEFASKPLKQRTIGDVVYEVVDRKGVHMIAMHRPIKTEFLTELDESKGEFFDYLPDNSPTRFANSTAVAFLEPGVTVAICKAQHAYSPGIAPLERFLSEFLLSPEGEQMRWKLAPLQVEGRADELRNSNRGISWYRTRFGTMRSLFSEGRIGLHSKMSEIADLLKSELNIEIEVQLPRGARSRTTERALKDFILRDLDETAQHGSGAKAMTISSSGEQEILNLVAEKLTVEFDMPPEATERQAFSDLTSGMHTVLSELQDHIHDAHR